MSHNMGRGFPSSRSRASAHSAGEVAGVSRQLSAEADNFPHDLGVCLSKSKQIRDRGWVTDRAIGLARISHQLSAAATNSGVYTAFRSVGLLDVLSSTPAGPSVARLVSMPACAASLRNPVRNAG